MIIPTAEFDPLFADDGIPFRTKMHQYIQREFADLLELRAATWERDEEQAPRTDSTSIILSCDHAEKHAA